jgi:hypothetical protein
MQYDFAERLAFSTKLDGRSYEMLIAETLPGIASVTKTSVEADKTGIDYVATLRRGGVVNIDLKKRDKGCSRKWQYGEEELALETWSVMNTKGNRAKVGWTLDEAKQTHYTLHVFDITDSQNAFLLPFQLLRKAFRHNLMAWYEQYFHFPQNSGTWDSECVFVPVSIVLDAIVKAARIQV